MLTRPEVDEAEAEAKIALIFTTKFYILISFSQKKNEIFG